MAYFVLTNTDGDRIEAGRTAFASVRNILCEVAANGESEKTTVFIKGKKVSIREAIDHTNDLLDRWVKKQ